MVSSENSATSCIPMIMNFARMHDAMEERCSWKKFYAERKDMYKSKFPFLKADQVASKLKRIWSREKRNCNSLEVSCEWVGHDSWWLAIP